jgi:hypothetical protein
MEHLKEVLTSNDPVEKWIADFVKSDNPKFDGKTKKERIKMALGAFYASQDKKESVSEKRDQKIVALATDSSDSNLIRLFIESNEGVASKSMLTIKDLWENFDATLVEALTISPNSIGKVKCVASFGDYKEGEIYEGVWKEAEWQHELRLDLNETSIFYNKDTKQVSLNNNFQLL